VEAREEDGVGERLVVLHPSVDRLNATLVRAGVRVHELRAQRRSLEQTVLDATSSGTEDAR